MKRLRVELRRLLDHARTQTAPGLPAPTAVHELRRALRQARALLELVPDDSTAPLAAALKRAHGSAGGLRDAEVIAELFAELAASEPRFATLAARAQRQRERSHARAPRVLGQLASALASLEPPVTTARPSLARTRKRLRRALARAVDHDDFDSAHRLRRRIKSAIAQVALLAPAATDFLAHAQKATKAIGEAADHAAALAFAESHGAGKKLRHPLTKELDRQRRRGLRRAAKLDALFPG